MIDRDEYEELLERELTWREQVQARQYFLFDGGLAARPKPEPVTVIPNRADRRAQKRGR